MRVNMRHVVEIAGGLVLGSLAADAVNGVGKLAKAVVVKLKDKGSKKAQALSLLFFFVAHTSSIMESRP